MIVKGFNLKNPWHVLAVGFGSGLSPIAPGTFGTLMAVPIYFLFLESLIPEAYAIVLCVTAVFGCVICHKASRDLGVHDHPSIVWDEFVGYWITMFMAPSHWVWMIVGFILFRFFDIVKPWPIKVLDEKVPGGIGIMVDDILAGLISWCFMYGLIKIFG